MGFPAFYMGLPAFYMCFLAIYMGFPTFYIGFPAFCMGLLAFFMFWFFEWLRPRDAVAIVVAYCAGLYALAYETGWMADVYRQQYQIGCA